MKSIVAAIFLLGSLTSLAQSKLPQCQGDVGSWNNCYGRVDYPYGEYYAGEWRGGKPHGRGVHEETNGEKYDGDWVGGKRHGTGKVEYPDGGKFIGQWRNDEKNGYGEDVEGNGGSYKGEYKNGTHNGNGTRIHSDGSKFVGVWKDGLASKGTIYLKNGDVYIGEFVNGKYDGVGKFTKVNGEIYAGSFSNGRPNGRGVHTLSDGVRYEGNFVDGRYEGEGVMTYPNGASYKGQWKDGKIWSGTHINSSGDKFSIKNGESIYDGGKFASQCRGKPGVDLEILEGLSRLLKTNPGKIQLERVKLAGASCVAVFYSSVGAASCLVGFDSQGKINSADYCR